MAKANTKEVSDSVVNESVKQEKSATVSKKEFEETKQQLNKALELIEQLMSGGKTVAPAQTQRSLTGKKIKVVNLLNHRVNLSTEPLGGGKTYMFESYGSFQKIKFDDLEDCYNSYRKTFENGWVYIADKDAVEELGLADDYKSLHDKDTVDRVIQLPTEVEVGLFLGMPKDLQESIARRIAEEMASGKKYDLNLTHQIENEAGFDFDKMVSDIKVYQTNLE